MATYEKIANLKGPKGHGIANPRIVGDALVVDAMDGTEVSEAGKVVGNVRGPVGPKGPMPTLQVSAAAGGEDLEPEAVVSETPSGYSVELLNTKGRTPELSASVVTGAPGTDASVEVTNTDAGADFAFTVPRGDRGEVGPAGPKGPMPSLRASVPDNGGSPSAAPSVRVVEMEGGYALEFLDLKGPVGPVPRIEMQPPLNLAHGSTPTVSFYEASPGVYRLQLGLVQGEPGTASDAIRDDVVDVQHSWSSQFTQTKIREAVDALIADGTLSELTGWSSQKIRAEIDAAVVESLPWGSITEKPDTFPPDPHSHSWDSVTGKPATFPPDLHSHDWGSIKLKPSSFPPASHSHSTSHITSGVFTEARLPNAGYNGKGIVQYATNTEVIAGVETLKAVAPGGLRKAFDAWTAPVTGTVTVASGRFRLEQSLLERDASGRVYFQVFASQATSISWDAGSHHVFTIPPEFAPSATIILGGASRAAAVGSYQADAFRITSDGSVYWQRSSAYSSPSSGEIGVSGVWKV